MTVERVGMKGKSTKYQVLKYQDSAPEPCYSDFAQALCSSLLCSPLPPVTGSLLLATLGKRRLGEQFVGARDVGLDVLVHVRLHDFVGRRDRALDGPPVGGAMRLENV